MTVFLQFVMVKLIFFDTKIQKINFHSKIEKQKILSFFLKKSKKLKKSFLLSDFNCKKGKNGEKSSKNFPIYRSKPQKNLQKRHLFENFENFQRKNGKF